jgi:hypothetical protein
MKEEISLYVSSTEACTDKLKRELEGGKVYDIERLKDFIQYQRSLCNRLKASLDLFIGDS